MSDLTIEQQQRDGVTVLTLTGEASLVNIGPLEQAFLKARATRPQRLVLDLSGLRFISSLGMGTIISLHRDLLRQGGELRLAAVPPLIADALQHARLTDLLIIDGTVDAAVAGD